MPPQWMWPYEEKLESWFANIKSKKESGSVEDSTGETTAMTKNDLADVGDRFKR